MTSEYIKQAQKFLKDNETRLNINFIKTGKHFKDDKEDRDLYHFILSNKNGIYAAQFGDSIQNTRYRLSGKTIADNKPAWKKPNAYDILSCLSGYDPEDFENFCAAYGYDDDSISALKVYDKVKAEYAGLRTMFTDEQLEQLNDIQ